jgi:hypothetical protein
MKLGGISKKVDRLYCYRFLVTGGAAGKANDLIVEASSSQLLMAFVLVKGTIRLR